MGVYKSGKLRGSKRFEAMARSGTWKNVFNSRDSREGGMGNFKGGNTLEILFPVDHLLVIESAK